MFRIILQRTHASSPHRCGGALAIHTSRGYSKLPGGHEARQAGFGKFLVILTPFAVGGGVVAYAKYDNEFRKTLVRTVPAVEPVLKVLLQEENPLEDVTKKISDVTSSVTSFFGVGGDSKPKEEPKRESKPTATAFSMPRKETSTPPVPAPELEKPAGKATASKSAEKATASPPPPPSPVKKTPAVPTKLPEDINELERLLESTAATAVKEYNKAIVVLKAYNAEVKRIVEESVDKVDPSSWVTLKNKTSTRDAAVEAAEKAANQARAAIENIEKSLYKSADKLAPEVRENVRNKIQNYMEHLNSAKTEVFKAIEKADLSEKYWKKVEQARNYFVHEIESLFPSVNFADKKLNLSKDDLDLFLVYAHSQILACQKELQKITNDGDTRLKRAIDALRGDDKTEAVRAQVEYEVEKMKREVDLDNQRRIFKVKAETEKALLEQLKKQAQAHQDHIKEALELKEEELRRVFNREMDERISKEQSSYKLQLAQMLGKIKGMDDALKARADSERSAHQAQSLWAACQALWSSVRSGAPGVSWREKLRPLESEITAVGIAAEGDELVAVVLNGLPDEARKRGVYPEDALRERFFKVDEVARRVALVPAEGARLPIYLLSYVQSILIATPSHPISKAELQDQPFDYGKLDSFEVLNRARYWLERGDLTRTLRYMNLLQGAPRKIAAEWMKEARLLLETQQAANTLMAHASASGLRYL